MENKNDLLGEYTGMLKAPGVDIQGGASLEVNGAGELLIRSSTGMETIRIVQGGILTPAGSITWADLREVINFCNNMKRAARGY